MHSSLIGDIQATLMQQCGQLGQEGLALTTLVSVSNINSPILGIVRQFCLPCPGPSAPVPSNVVQSTSHPHLFWGIGCNGSDQICDERIELQLGGDTFNLAITWDSSNDPGLRSLVSPSFHQSDFIHVPSSPSSRACGLPMVIPQLFYVYTPE